MIEPIDDERRAEVIAATNSYLQLAETVYQHALADVHIRFDLSGSSAGMFKVAGGTNIIRYNPWLFAKYFSENLSGTVPHEVAHFAVHCHYRRRVKPHGPEWLALMQAFDADPSVTCNFDLSGIPRRQQRRYNYRCDCRLHEVSARRHNTMLRGKGRYQCLQCKGELTPTQLPFE